LDVRSEPYSRRILKHYSPRKLRMSIRPSSITRFNHRYHLGTYWHHIINITNMASIRTSKLVTTRGHTLQCELEAPFSAWVFNPRPHLRIIMYFKSCSVI